MKNIFKLLKDTLGFNRVHVIDKYYSGTDNTVDYAEHNARDSASHPDSRLQLACRSKYAGEKTYRIKDTSTTKQVYISLISSVPGHESLLYGRFNECASGPMNNKAYMDNTISTLNKEIVKFASDDMCYEIAYAQKPIINYKSSINGNSPIKFIQIPIRSFGKSLSSEEGIFASSAHYSKPGRNTTLFSRVGGYAGENNPQKILPKIGGYTKNT